MAPEATSPTQQLLSMLDTSQRRKARRLIRLIEADALRQGRRLLGEAVGHVESNTPPVQVTLKPM